MRIIYRLGAMAVIVTGYTACIFFDEKDYSTETSANSTSAGGSGAASSTGNSGGNGGGGDGGAQPTCVPSENKGPVDDSCGVFVSSNLGDDSGDGTKEKPFKTLGKALKAAPNQGKRVYACAEEFSEILVASSGTTLYGGLRCNDGWQAVGSITKTNWQYVGGSVKTTLKGLANKIPLTVRGEAATIHVEDFSVLAASASEPGGSSIAVLVDEATATFQRCDLTAGDGSDGTDGAAPPDAETQAPNGNAGNLACTGFPNSNSVLGGDPMPNPMCPASVGGKGGDGSNENTNGGAGDAGTGPFIGAMNSGAGQIYEGPNCSNGGSGTDGGNGAKGDGATALGTLSSAGYTGADGANGYAGGVAQGGGGGGGKRSRDCTPNTGSWQGGPGASGGSGGPGGCGGVGGQGGKAGGASIALVSIQAHVTLKDVKLTAANGGQGGDGREGQTGQPGGNGGDGGLGLNNVAPGCNGGKGGKGGDGGHGGGGRGGHSIGIAYTGDAPSRDDEVTIALSAMAASGGTGGTPGTEGLVVDMQSF